MSGSTVLRFGNVNLNDPNNTIGWHSGVLTGASTRNAAALKFIFRLPIQRGRHSRWLRNSGERGGFR
jgi:hypothetical protein